MPSLHGMADAPKPIRPRRMPRRSELRGTFRPAGRSGVDVASEPGPHQKSPCGSLRGTASVEDIDFRTARGLDRSGLRSLTQKSAWVANHEQFSCWVPRGSGRAGWPARWRRRLVATGSGLLLRTPRAVSRLGSGPRGRQPAATGLGRLNRLDVLIVDDWVMRRWRKGSGETSGRSARIATRRGRRF